MKRQKSIIVNGKKICIKASIENGGFNVKVDTNGKIKVYNAMIMITEDYDETFGERFIKKAMDIAYAAFVQKEYEENHKEWEGVEYDV